MCFQRGIADEQTCFHGEPSGGRHCRPSVFRDFGNALEGGTSGPGSLFKS